jgi:hypothetical protein
MNRSNTTLKKFNILSIPVRYFSGGIIGNKCCGSGSDGFVISLPPGSGSVILNFGFEDKVQYFIIYNYLPI